MAEKRGQYEYRDDGTSAQLVTADSTITESLGMLGLDHQATQTNTAVTHTSAVIPNGTGNAQATWQLVPDGMSEFITNLTQDTGVTTVAVNVNWSEDGTAISGKTASTVPSNTNTQRTSNTWFPVGGAFYKVEIYNGDATPRTCSANIRFRP